MLNDLSKVTQTCTDSSEIWRMGQKLGKLRTESEELDWLGCFVYLNKY